VPVLDDQGLLCTPETQPCNGTNETNPNYDPLNGVIIGGVNSPFGSKVARENYGGVSPRFGIAWDPTGQGKMSVRAGYGVFVESPGIGFVENNVFANPPFVGTVTIQNAPFDNPAGGQTSPNNAPTPLGGTEARFKQPYTQQWNLSIERQIISRVVTRRRRSASRSWSQMTYPFRPSGTTARCERGCGRSNPDIARPSGSSTAWTGSVLFCGGGPSGSRADHIAPGLPGERPTTACGGDVVHEAKPA